MFSRETKLTVLWLLAGAMALVAFILDSGALYFMSAFALVLAVAGRVFGLLTLRGLRTVPHTPMPPVAGEQAEILVEVRNGGSLPRFDVDVVAPLGGGLPEAEASARIAFLPPRAAAVAALRVQTRLRGVFPVGPISLSHVDLFGLSRVSRAAGRPVELVVYPRALGVPLGPLLGGDLLGAERTARNRGAVDGSDFYGIRPYRPGDEWRRIHWRTTARTGQLMVIEREELASLSLVVLIDLAVPGGEEMSAPLEVLVALAAQLAEQAVRRIARLDLVLLSEAGEVASAVSGVESLEEALDALARLDQRPGLQWRPPGDLPDIVGAGPALVLLTDRLDDRVSATAQAWRDLGFPGAIVQFALRPEDEPDVERFLLPVWRLGTKWADLGGERAGGETRDDGRATASVEGEADYYVEPVARV